MCRAVFLSKQSDFQCDKVDTNMPLNRDDFGKKIYWPEKAWKRVLTTPPGSCNLTRITKRLVNKKGSLHLEIFYHTFELPGPHWPDWLLRSLDSSNKTQMGSYLLQAGK